MSRRDEEREAEELRRMRGDIEALVEWSEIEGYRVLVAPWKVGKDRFAIVLWEGEPWIVWQHPDGQWVTRQRVNLPAAAQWPTEGLKGAVLIAEERKRQIVEERWSLEHDDQHRDGSLAVIAAALAVEGTDARVHDPLGRGSESDPWGLLSKHGGDRVRALTIAGALIAAEIERVLRTRPVTTGDEDE